MKKLLTLLFTAALALSLSAVSFAQDTGSAQTTETKKEAKAEKKAAKKKEKAEKRLPRRKRRPQKKQPRNRKRLRRRPHNKDSFVASS